MHLVAHVCLSSCFRALSQLGFEAKDDYYQSRIIPSQTNQGINLVHPIPMYYAVSDGVLQQEAYV